MFLPYFRKMKHFYGWSILYKHPIFLLAPHQKIPLNQNRLKSFSVIKLRSISIFYINS